MICQQEFFNGYEACGECDNIYCDKCKIKCDFCGYNKYLGICTCFGLIKCISCNKFSCKNCNNSQDDDDFYDCGQSYCNNCMPKN